MVSLATTAGIRRSITAAWSLVGHDQPLTFSLEVDIPSVTLGAALGIRQADPLGEVTSLFRGLIPLP